MLASFGGESHAVPVTAEQVKPTSEASGSGELKITKVEGTTALAEGAFVCWDDPAVATRIMEGIWNVARRNPEIKTLKLLITIKGDDKRKGADRSGNIDMLDDPFTSDDLFVFRSHDSLDELTGNPGGSVYAQAFKTLADRIVATGSMKVPEKEQTSSVTRRAGNVT